MNTYNVTLYATYTVNANSFSEAIDKARERAEVYDLDCGYSDVEKIEYDPEFN